jgi:hypothetical protein
VSPAFVAVGYVNNAEFIGQYEDAHRQRNLEKSVLLSWGAEPQIVDKFYLNSAFTKLQRRHLFAALDVLPDRSFAVALFRAAADSRLRYEADRYVATYTYISALSKDGKIAAYGRSTSPTPQPLIVTHDGRVIWPIYADYLTVTPEVKTAFDYLTSRSGRGTVHVLGHASQEAAQMANNLGLELIEIQDRD